MILNSSAILDACKFTNNSAYYGGAVQVLDGGNLNISNSQMFKNSATNGGAIFSRWSTVHVDSCTISNGSATTYGGGLFAEFSNSILY